MYDGLTISDKPALLEAKERGKTTLTMAFSDRVQVVNIDLALAQIEEMESAEKPMTINDWLNQASADQKARWLLLRFPSLQKQAVDMALRKNINSIFCSSYREHLTELLNSPYTEGETK